MFRGSGKHFPDLTFQLLQLTNGCRYLDQRAFFGYLKESRFSFLPQIHDASPRVYGGFGLVLERLSPAIAMFLALPQCPPLTFPYPEFFHLLLVLGAGSLLADLLRFFGVGLMPWSMCYPCVPRSTQALALDVPMLMNAHISGGWKYVTPQAGGDGVL